MICGSCLHDNTLVQAMIDQGEEALLVPTYTPLRTDETDVSLDRVFMGGINVYLQQKLSLFQKTPAWARQLLDHPALLRWTTRGAAAVDPAKLGDMTVSMLQGLQGKQHKELEKLTCWLADDLRPDIVHLSNSMLLGLANPIAERTGATVVCSLSGEDLFLEQLSPPYYQQARDLLCQKAQAISAFVALNQYYANFMAQYLSIDRSKIHVIPHGLNLNGYERTSQKTDAPKNDSATLTVGFLARICHAKGLHLLVEACKQLASDRPELSFRLQATGYLGKGDVEYLRQIETQVATGPFAGRFEYLGEPNRAGKIAFLQSLDLFALPTIYPESKGLPALEALASGTPLLLPNHGGFPELLADTGGGQLHKPLDQADLATQLAGLLENPEQRTSHAAAGQAAVFDRYHANRMADQTLRLYRDLRP